ncbi:DUF3093 domain-containing protein [Kribbella turkmenica]|uniref:DUF3093 domain-containing protein n=1 Tax=Kribbella turkmenica TaxID=2530375 RepID=A0A4R4WS84_9ACTN|nr:DUF3093 domain-containing protein [Kribbella turkmenica]TDD20419.1 DUF3093 domain-containing protein [Kribbella turkmenica]
MTSYRERLSVPVSWWIVATALVVTLFVIVAVPVGMFGGAFVGGLAGLVLVLSYLQYGGARVEVDAQQLRAGRAVIDRVHLGTVEALTGDDARHAFGRDCDPKAYLLLRSYVKGAVRVEITDPHDPAPYWVISTRRPEGLAAALTGHSVTRS